MNTVYQNLSRYRSELMGLAMLWVMLFHAYEFHFYVPLLDALKGIGFAGVDVFILLSAMGLYVSLYKASKRERERESFQILPAPFCPRSAGLLAGGWPVQPVADLAWAHRLAHGFMEPVHSALLVSYPRCL